MSTETQTSAGQREAYRRVFFVMILAAIGGLAFAAGLAYSTLVPDADAADVPEGAAAAVGGKAPRVIYPKRTDLDFEGLKLQGEVRSPGEFYFQHRNEEKFDSLVKRRKNFHQEMLRDAVLSK